MTAALALLAAGLFGVGTWLLLQRRLSRIVIGVGLLGHGANTLLVLAGRRGAPPFDPADADSVADPLPHAMALTAIVITFGITTFLLALAHRSWRLTRDDEVEDDVEDRLMARRDARHDQDVLDQIAAELDPDGDGVA